LEQDLLVPGRVSPRGLELLVRLEVAAFGAELVGAVQPLPERLSGDQGFLIFPANSGASCWKCLRFQV
jgi:hypothetical protein